MQFVFDLDGTICFKGQPVSELILETLENMTRAGHEVIFASARPIRDMLPVLHERFHGYTLIGGNGALVSQQGKLVYARAFTPEQVEKLLQLIVDYAATYLIDSEWDYAYTGPADHPILQNVDTARLAQQVEVTKLASIVKVLLLTASDLEGMATELSSLGVVLHKHRNENVVDISPAGIHKWDALQQIGVLEKKFIAFGNDANDIPMFRAAQHAVMIGHHEELSVYASESIALGDSCERLIVEKLEELTLA